MRRGLVGTVYSESMFNLSTGVVIADHMTNSFKDMYITVCSGACVDGETGIITNKRGSAKILTSIAGGSPLTLEMKITGVMVGDGYIINNAHKVKLAKNTDGDSIASSQDATFYTYQHGMHIMFRGTSRCSGRAARILAYTPSTRCATIGSNLEVGDYRTATAVATADSHPSNGMCTGANCDGPDVGGIRGMYMYVFQCFVCMCVFVGGRESVCRCGTYRASNSKLPQLAAVWGYNNRASMFVCLCLCVCRRGQRAHIEHQTQNCHSWLRCWGSNHREGR